MRWMILLLLPSCIGSYRVGTIETQYDYNHHLEAGEDRTHVLQLNALLIDGKVFHVNQVDKDFKCTTVYANGRRIKIEITKSEARIYVLKELERDVYDYELWHTYSNVRRI